MKSAPKTSMIFKPVSKKTSFNFKPKPKTHSNPILHLQKTVGNQAVNRVIQSSKTKNLQFSKPNDSFEQEASKISRQVVSNNFSIKNSKRLKRNLKRSLKNSNQSGYGKKLDSSVKPFMESRFGCAFDDVRIHADLEASRIASTFDASAFTVGNHIYFEKGQYQPQSTYGKKLIAHELTHVIQQSLSNTRTRNSSSRRVSIHQSTAIALIQRRKKKKKEKSSPTDEMMSITKELYGRTVALVKKHKYNPLAIKEDPEFTEIMSEVTEKGGNAQEMGEQILGDMRKARIPSLSKWKKIKLGAKLAILGPAGMAVDAATPDATTWDKIKGNVVGLLTAPIGAALGAAVAGTIGAAAGTAIGGFVGHQVVMAAAKWKFQKKGARSVKDWIAVGKNTLKETFSVDNLKKVADQQLLKYV